MRNDVPLERHCERYAVRDDEDEVAYFVLCQICVKLLYFTPHQSHFVRQLPLKGKPILVCAELYKPSPRGEGGPLAVDEVFPAVYTRFM